MRSRRQRKDACHSGRRGEDGAPRSYARRWDVLGLAGLLGAHLGFFWRAVLLRGFFVHSDICYFFEPAKHFMHECLRAGRLPLWSPYIFCGYPIAAEGQIAAFYPPSLLISWLLPSPAAINYLIVSHLVLAAVSMYLLARHLGISPFGSFVAGFVFSFSGCLFAHLHHIGLICAAAWLPLTLLFVDRAWRGRVLHEAPFAALTYAAAGLCGHPQTLFHITLAVLFLLVWRVIQGRGRRAARPYHRAVGLFALTTILGLGMACVQLLLTADLSASAPHGEIGTLEYVTSFSLLPKHLMGLIVPNWEGTPAFNTYRGERYYWEFVLYIGLLPLLLAVLGAINRSGRPWAVFGLTALVLALAAGNPLYHALRFVPGFAHFRVPARHILLFTLSAGILAGYGWESLARWAQRAGGRRVVVYGAFVVGLMACDLFHFDRTLAPLSGPEVYRATPRVVHVLKGDRTWGRCLIVPPIDIYADWVPAGGWAANPDGWLEARTYLPASVPMSYGLRMIGGYAGFVNPSQTIFFQSATVQAFESQEMDLFSLVGTRYLLVGQEREQLALPAAEIPPFTVYRNAGAFPRAFVVGEVVPAGSYDEAFLATAQLAGAGGLRSTAAVRGDLGSVAPSGQPKATLHIEEPRPERIVVGAQSDRDAVLVVNERWNPGWRVLRDGRPAPLLEVDSVLMGAALPAGEHTVEFLYRPRSFLIGRAVTLISLLVCAILIAFPRVRRERS